MSRLLESLSLKPGRYFFQYIFLLMFIGVFFVCAGWAQNESALRRDIRSHRANAKLLKRLLDEANRRDAELALKLADTTKRLLTTGDELKKTESSLEVATEKARQVQKRLQKTSLRLLRAQQGLEKRLRAIYMQGEVSYMAVLLQSDDFTDFLNQSDYLQRIVNSDSQLITAVKNHKGELSYQREEARRAVLELSELRRKKLDAVTALKRLKAAQDDLDKRLEAHQAKLSSRIDEVEHITVAKEKELRQMIRRRSNIYPAGVIPPRTAGAFIWPVRGPITSYFGYRIHPITGATRYHSGLDIAVDYGVPVLAADNGVVLDASWFGGYGNCVIIDHGGSWSTLYGHNSSLEVRAGQVVRQGQLIARVGSTGMSTGPHCHFEVRYQGNPVDPYSRL